MSANSIGKMTTARPQSNLDAISVRRPRLLFVPLALAGVLLILIRAFLMPTTVLESVAGLGVYLASLVALLAGRRFGYLSLGSATAALAIVAFWSKWLLDIQEHRGPGTISGQPSRAITVFAIFMVPYVAGWIFAIRNTGRIDERRRRVEATSPTVVRKTPAAKRTLTNLTGASTKGAGLSPALIGAVSLALLALRIFLASRYHLGVPGETSTAAGGGTHIFGLLYYLSAYGPLLGASVLMLTGRSRARFIFAIILLILYAIVGGELGYRSYGLLAAIVFVYAYQRRRRQALPHKRKSVAPNLILAVLLTAGLLTSVSFGLAVRPVASISGTGPIPAARFLYERIGGLDYLAPVVTEVDETGPSLANIHPSFWNNRVKTAVYGFSARAKNGLAATLVGLLFGVGGSVLLFIGGIGLGFLCGGFDRIRQPSRALTLPVETFYLGVLVAWLDLFLEGTVRTAAYALVTFSSVAAVSAAVSLARGRRKA